MPDRSVVFDTVCLSNFLLTDAVPVVTSLLGRRGAVTVEVFDELLAGVARYPTLGGIQAIVTAKKIKLVTLTVEEYRTFAGLLAFLQKGEASCLTLAQSRDMVVATDDKAARGECARRGIRCTGTVGILKNACNRGVLKDRDADALLVRMVAQGFYSPVQSISGIL